MVVFLLEERSMKAFLEVILPQIMGNEKYLLIPHEGKADLQRSIPKKLKGWNIPDTRFVIIQDQDSNDCISLKNKLVEICSPYHRQVLIRIACQELESWYFGDLTAVEEAYGKDLRRLRNSKKYVNPDAINDPKGVIKRFLPELTQIDGAKRIASRMDISRNSSHSFQVFVKGVQEFMK